VKAQLLYTGKTLKGAFHVLSIFFIFFSSYNAGKAERKVNTMKKVKEIMNEKMEIVKQKASDAVAYCKLHRNTVVGAATAFVGGLGSCIFINKFLSDKDHEEETDKRQRWQDDDDFEEATIEYDNAPIHGAWFTTEKGGKIFFAEDEDGNLP
jgi:hypothetical protein